MKRRNSTWIWMSVSLVLTVVFFAMTPGFIGYGNVLYPQVSNMSYELGQKGTVEVFLSAEGKIYVENVLVQNPLQLGRWLNRNIQQNNHLQKVVLLAHPKLTYGKVLSVLNQFKQVKIQSVFLSYQDNVSLVDVFSGREI